jgi:hypothetical protein
MQIYSVRDNGVGFNPAYINKLFGDFQRLHSADDFEGTGVGLRSFSGLSIGMAACMGKAEIGKGAAFYFSLPMKQGDQWKKTLSRFCWLKTVRQTQNCFTSIKKKSSANTIFGKRMAKRPGFFIRAGIIPLPRRREAAQGRLIGFEAAQGGWAGCLESD